MVIIPKGDIISSGPIKVALNQVVTDICMDTSKLFLSFPFNEDQIEQYLNYSIQLMIIRGLRKTKDITTVHINRVNFADFMGRTLFKCYLSNIKDFMRIFDFSKNVHMSEQILVKANYLVTAILQDDMD